MHDILPLSRHFDIDTTFHNYYYLSFRLWNFSLFQFDWLYSIPKAKNRHLYIQKLPPCHVIDIIVWDSMPLTLIFYCFSWRDTSKIDKSHWFFFDFTYYATGPCANALFPPLPAAPMPFRQQLSASLICFADEGGLYKHSKDASVWLILSIWW
jgi:hypothetical protein